jgi:two-component system, NarL family, sensor histidine kinase DesK
VIFRFVAAVAELRRAREELTRKAVEDERLRFACDPHDLLGRRLSVMVVKAQAVRRLSVTDPGLAAEQGADIERSEGKHWPRSARPSRGTAAGAWTRVLSDAGFSVVIGHHGHHPRFARTDALLSWVTREGVTNVIRHSNSRRCEIDVCDDDASTGWRSRTTAVAR